MRRFQLRIEALANKLHGGELVLLMADGSERPIHLQGRDGFGNFLRDALRNPVGPEATLIKSSLSQRELDGALLVELGRAILLSPSEDGQATSDRPRG